MARQSIDPIVVNSTGFMALPLAAHRFPAAVDGIDTIYEVYQESRSHLPTLSSFDFVKRAAESCAYVYGDFHAWCKIHAVAANITTTQFDFIVDSIRFIRSGKRRMNLVLWANVTKLQPGLQITEKQRATRLQILEAELEGCPVNVVPLWCSHEGGLDDVIVASAIMFGGIQSR